VSPDLRDARRQVGAGWPRWRKGWLQFGSERRAAQATACLPADRSASTECAARTHRRESHAAAKRPAPTAPARGRSAWSRRAWEIRVSRWAAMRSRGSRAMTPRRRAAGSPASRSAAHAASATISWSASTLVLARRACIATLPDGASCRAESHGYECDSGFCGNGPGCQGPDCPPTCVTPHPASALDCDGE
jgi:hypothetical protein